MARFSLRIPDSLLKKVKDTAESEEVSDTQIIQDAVQAYLIIKAMQKEGNDLFVQNDRGQLVKLVLI